MNTIEIDGKLYRLTPVKQEKKTTALFTLTMPGTNTWNGKWSGEGKIYAMSRTAFSRGKAKYPLLNEGDYGYDFGDGWYANVNVRFVTPSESKSAMRKSQGFMGYEWMVNELCLYGRIRTRDEKIKERKQEHKDLYK